MFVILYVKISKYLKVKQVKNGLRVLNINKQIFTKFEIEGMLKVFKYIEKRGEINV